MDPLSITATVAGLIGTCGQVAKRINYLIRGYNDAPLVVSSIASETAMLSAALSQIEQVAVHDPDSLISRLDGPLGFRIAFDTGLSSCSLVLSVLRKYLSAMTGKKQTTQLEKSERIRVVWNQDRLQDLLKQIKRQQNGVNLLISALQTESLAEIKDIFHKNSGLLNNIVRRSAMLHVSTPGASASSSALSQSQSRTSHINQSAQKTTSPSNVAAPAPTGAILNGTDPIRETTAFIAASLVDAIEQNNSDLVDRLLVRGCDVNVAAPGNRAPLIAAVKKEDTDLVKKLLDCGADTEAKDNESKTALIWAAEKGFTAMATSLLERGAKIDAPGHEGMNALNQAAFSGQFELVELLLGFGADIETLDDDGMNPLHNASQFGHLETMEFLLRMGARVDVFDKRQRTALPYAVVSQKAAPVELLLQWGADAGVEDNEGFLPIHWAVIRDSSDVLSAFLRNGKYVEATSRNDSQVRPLHHAATEGKVDNVKLLLDKNADIEALDARNRTPLITAVDFGHLDVVKTLLGRKAETTARTIEEYSALTIAVIAGRTDIAKELLDAHADISDTYKQHSLLQLAVQSGKLEMVTFLLDRGVDVNQRGGLESSNPLLDATLLGKVEMIQLLLRRRASVNVKDMNLATPIHRAAFTGNCEILAILLSQSDKHLVNAATTEGQTALLLATTQKRVEAAQLLIRHKAKVNTKDKAGDEPIHWAAETNCSDLIHLLVKEGASVKAKDSDDNTPLHRATGAEAADALLQYKANMEKWNKWTQTPLDRMAQFGHNEAAAVLLKRGAKVDSQNKDKEIPLHRAIACNQPKMVKLLLDWNASATYLVTRRKLNSMHVAVETEDVDVQIIKDLLDKEPSLLNAVDKDGKPPLYLALIMGTTSAAVALIERGAATDYQDKDGWTPLMIAASKQQRTVVDALLKSGCNVFAVNRDEKRTALHYVATTPWVDVARVLLGKGLDPRAKDNWGTTPVDCAEARSSEPEMAKVLARGG